MRVIDYTLQDSATPTQDSCRLVTNILDADAAPALELAALYRERWEIEGVFDEFKTHLRSNSTVLRSKTPELVQQELRERQLKSSVDSSPAARQRRTAPPAQTVLAR